MLYYVGQPHSANGLIASSRSSAISMAERIARRTGRAAHIHTLVRGPGHRASKGRLLTLVGPRGAIGLGQTLTDWACENATFAQTWRGRLGGAIDTAIVGSVVGAGAAGLLGGILKRPLLGAAVGALTGWAASAIWLAPERP